VELDDARTIGQRLRQIRYARGKSLRVLAGLAGISKSQLSEFERGERALDSLKQIVALANALRIAPSDLTRLPVPAPANGHTDSAIERVRLALLAVGHDLPGGQVLPAEALRARVMGVVDALCRCDREGEVGPALSGLIRDLHASVVASRDVAELLPLVTLLHTQATVPWLRLAGASLDLCSQAILLARQAAEEHNTPAPMGLVAASASRVMLVAGAFDLAQTRLDAVSVPTDTSDSMQLAGLVALRRSLVAAADGRPGDVAAPLEYATELAQRTGEKNAYGLGFGPISVGLFRVSGMVESGDHEGALNLAEGLNPDAHANLSSRAFYWVNYGRAAARVRGRHDDAVRALRRAELISPHHVQRNPLVREVVAELFMRSHRDPVGRELRGMAYRAGLPV
jgi:transcriptional regulator with XRE-family HTH domain